MFVQSTYCLPALCMVYYTCNQGSHLIATSRTGGLQHTLTSEKEKSNQSTKQKEGILYAKDSIHRIRDL